MPKKRLREYAEEIGAVSKSGRVNWQAVAENLAQKYEPGLLEGEPGPGVGRPKSAWFGLDAWLAAEIEHVKITNRLSSDIEACKKISKNNFLGASDHDSPVPERGPDGKLIFGADGELVLKWVKERWPNFFKGMNPETLKRRYLAWNKREGISRTRHEIRNP